MTAPVSVAEYLRWERSVPTKHEYIDGRIIDMSGGTPNHSRIATDLQTALSNGLRNAPVYEVFNSDQRLRVADGGPFFYPDVTVACESSIFDTDDCLRNPCLLIEVLSPSTRAFDRDEKFRAYRRIASLRHYVLVASDAVRVEHFERLPGGVWALVGEHEALTGMLSFSDLPVTVPLTEIYRRVSLVASAQPEQSI
jgi:Uma2 family endonuclease